MFKQILTGTHGEAEPNPVPVLALACVRNETLFAQEDGPL